MVQIVGFTDIAWPKIADSWSGLNASSDYETGEVRCYIILLQNSILRPERNEKLATRLCSNWKLRNQVTEWIALQQTTIIYQHHPWTNQFSLFISRQKFCSRPILQIFIFSGSKENATFIQKKWHKMKDKRPLFVARCSQPTNSIFFLWFAGSKFGYFSQFTVFVWKCNMTLIWVCVICWGAQTKRAKPRNFVQSNKSLTR